MPLNKVQFNPGINKEITKYTNEAGWSDCDKVRFRQGYPEKIGGWTRHGGNTFTGVCRSLHQWISLAFVKYTGLGTNVKFMVETGQDYYDITPLRTTVSLTDKMFSTTGAPFMRILDPAGGFVVGSYVTFSGASAVGDQTVDGEKVITDVDTLFTDATCDYNNDPTITHDANARIYPGLPVSGTGIPAGAYVASINSSTSFELSASTTGGSVTDGTLTFDGTKVFTVATSSNSSTAVGGGTFTLAYQVNVGPDFQIPVDGWSSSPWNANPFNGGNGGAESLRVWSQANYGEDLIIGPRGGEMYYWDTSAGTGTRAIPLKNVLHNGTIALSQTSTGNIAAIIPGITSLDTNVTPKIRDGAVVTCTTAGKIAAGTTVLSKTANNAVVNLSANPLGDGTTLTFVFDSDPISVTKDSKSITVFDPTLEFNYMVGQYVTIAGATTVAAITGTVINARHKIATVDSASNTFTTEPIAGAEPASSTTSGGGASVTLQYELSAEVPVVQDQLLVSDASRFVFAFGCNAFGDATEEQNPLLLRWSDQENAYDWRPRSTNQAGDLQLSQGTEIVTAIQSRQEILVFTDAALYSLQYVGAPVVWGSTLVGSNLSVASSKAAAYANGVTYWMGKEKFYKYDGTVQPLRCDVRKYVFDDLDRGQYEQTFAGTLEEYHEIWWFYCDSQRVAPNKYVVYNYLEDIWYVGSMGRSAWYDSPINDFPLAATDTYNLVEHENGNDNGQGATLEAIDSFITSGQFGIESGTSFTFIDKVVPDLSFVGSSAGSPSVEMSLLASSEPGAADNIPASEGGVNEGQVVLAVDTVDEYTDQLDVRVRGRQMAIKVRSNALGTKWQLGTPRLNMRPDGRRGR